MHHFGRQRNRIIAEALLGKHAGLGLPNSNNDLVFTVGGVPYRFSNDDPSNPSKDAVQSANRYQMDFFEFAVRDEPARFCFIIDRGHDGAADPLVEFLGFSPSGEVACRWVSSTVRVLRLVQRSLAFWVSTVFRLERVIQRQPTVGLRSRRSVRFGSDLGACSRELIEGERGTHHLASRRLPLTMPINPP